MAYAASRIRVAGSWLAIASFLMLVTLVFHGPIAPELADQMTRIADGALRWSVVHWIAAAGLSLYAVAGLIVLTSDSRLTRSWWTLTAWAILPVSALWTVTTALAETTVVADAALAGARDTFEAWWAFAEGYGSGFAFFALAVAVIAGHEARSADGVGPAWVAWIAVAAGIGSFTGWALGMWIGIRFGNLLWVASSILMTVWTLWFGVALARVRTAGMEQPDRSPSLQHR